MPCTGGRWPDVSDSIGFGFLDSGPGATPVPSVGVLEDAG